MKEQRTRGSKSVGDGNLKYEGANIYCHERFKV